MATWLLLGSLLNTQATANEFTCCLCITEDQQRLGCSEDPICEQLVCADDNLDGDSRCCSLGWRQNPCANVAIGVCNNLETCCSCLNGNDNGGCIQDGQCETEICDLDPFCCNNEWDNICIKQATAICTGEEVPRCCGCTVQNPDGGCLNDPECENQICEADPFCCRDDVRQLGFWDRICTLKAGIICGDITLPPTNITSDTPTNEPTVNPTIATIQPTLFLSSTTRRETTTNIPSFNPSVNNVLTTIQSTANQSNNPTSSDTNAPTNLIPTESTLIRPRFPTANEPVSGDQQPPGLKIPPY